MPALMTAEANPAADRRALAALADWCGRYTPWTAVDDDRIHAGPYGGGGGLWLDITGCGHLFGGEGALLDDLLARLDGLGFAAAGAVADTPGAAWAVARFAPASRRIVGGGDGATLAALPVAALGLPPVTLADLDRLGLRRLGDLAALPRAPLAARFGPALLTRLDQLFGRCDEPITPRRPIPALAARLAFAEPIAGGGDVLRATEHLLADLCARMAAARQGARRLELGLFRSDGSVVTAAVGTSRPVRDAGHLLRLMRDKLERIDAGFGIELAILAATVVAPLAATQMDLERMAAADDGLARLVDRLGNRLDPGNVVRLLPRPSHVPERACRPRPAAAVRAELPVAGDERGHQPRPLLLLPSPEPIDVIAPVPDGPPVLFRRGRRRHRLVAAEGPERIGGEWWLEADGLDGDPSRRLRDYYRVEDGDGRRFWIYREGPYRPDTAPRWYLHGLFA